MDRTASNIEALPLERNAAIPATEPLLTGEGEQPKRPLFSFGPTVKAERPLMDALRFVLATVVACSHLTIPIIKVLVPAPPILIYLAAGGVSGLGAVYCFFAISGYVIAASAEREPHDFYLRRAIRIYPVYWGSLAFAMVCWIGFNAYWTPDGRGDLPTTWHTFTPVAAVMQFIGLPWIFTPAAANFGQSWSLTCEIIYYALVPMFKKMSTPIILGLMAASYLLFDHLDQGDWAWHDVTPTLCLAWFWLAGWLYYRHRDHPAAGAIFGVFTVTMLVSRPCLPWMCAATGLIIGCGRFFRFHASLSKFCGFLGGVSYPFYLIHIPVFMLLAHFWAESLAPYPEAYVVIAALAGCVMYICVDLPCRRFLIKRLEVRQAYGVSNIVPK